MSYSITIIKPTKAEAIAEVAAQLDAVAAGQACHLRDRDQARAAATAYIGLLDEPQAGQAVSVTVSGSLTGTWAAEDEGTPGELEHVAAAAISITAGLAPAPL